MATDDTLYERVGEGVYTFLQGIGLVKDNNQGAMSVYNQTLPYAAVLDFPCCIVSWEDNAEEEEMTFISQLIMYPIHVVLADRQPGEDESWRPGFLAARKLIQDALRPKTSLPGCPEVYDVRLQNNAAIPSNLFTDPKYQYVVSAMTVKVFTSEDYHAHP